MSYYADGSWGNNGNQPPFGSPGTSTSPGNGMAPVGPGAFQASPQFGGGSSYYDTTAGGQAGYEKFVQGMTGQPAGGTGDGGKFGNYLRSRFNTENNQYAAAQGSDPSLTFTNYLQGQQGNLQQQYEGQNPYDKGEQGQRALKWL